MADPDRDQSRPEAALGRRQRKAMAVRRALLDAGLKAFEREPFGLVSILDITEMADVAKGVFYLQFNSKDDFLVALLEDRQRVVRGAVAEAVAGLASTRERLEAAIRAYGRLAHGSPETARFWLRMSGYFSDEIGTTGELAGLRSGYLRRLGATIAGADESSVGPADLKTAAVVDACCWGLISQSIQLGNAHFDEAAFVQIVSSAVEPVLGAGGAP